MRVSSARLLALSVISFGACDQGESTPPDGVEIQIAPIAYPGVTEVCYALTVVNSKNNPVWSNDNVCSGTYGNAGGGDVSYVGPCDAQLNKNKVKLVLKSIAVLGGPGILDDQITSLPPGGDGDADFVNPCPANAPCEQSFNCIENSDVLVPYDITVIRDADQGFFDIAVAFEDFFCSAKADTCYQSGQHIDLLDGDDTAVIGVACTAGPDSVSKNIDTEILFSTYQLACNSGDATNGPVFYLPLDSAAGNNTTNGSVEGSTAKWSLYKGNEVLNCGSGTGHLVDDQGRYRYQLGPNATFYATFASGVWTVYNAAGVAQGSQPGDAQLPPASIEIGGDYLYTRVTGTVSLSCNKKYFNIAIHLDHLVAQGLSECRLIYNVTAKDAADNQTFEYGLASGKPGTIHAAFNGMIQLIANGQTVCQQNPLGGFGFNGIPSKVTPFYMGQLLGLPQFCYAFGPTSANATKIDFTAPNSIRTTAANVGSITTTAPASFEIRHLGMNPGAECHFPNPPSRVDTQWRRLDLGSSIDNLHITVTDYATADSGSSGDHGVRSELWGRTASGPWTKITTFPTTLLAGFPTNPTIDFPIQLNTYVEVAFGFTLAPTAPALLDETFSIKVQGQALP